MKCSWYPSPHLNVDLYNWNLALGYHLSRPFFGHLPTTLLPKGHGQLSPCPPLSCSQMPCHWYQGARNSVCFLSLLRFLPGCVLEARRRDKEKATGHICSWWSPCTCQDSNFPDGVCFGKRKKVRLRTSLLSLYSSSWSSKSFQILKLKTKLKILSSFWVKGNINLFIFK